MKAKKSGKKTKIEFSEEKLCSGSVFFDLPDPDPLVRGMDPALYPDPSIIMQK
jgi:hypothetical protein